MHLLKGFFRFIGILSFMAFLVFLLLENEVTAYICLAMSLSFLTLVQLIKIYIAYLVRKYDEDFEQPGDPNPQQ